MMEMDKALYDKKIVYLDYLERGEKVKNGGFVKWESKGAESRVQIRIRGLYPTDTLQGEILLVSAGKLHRADRIGLQFGAGEYAGIWKNDNLAGTGLSFAECDGVQVQISDKRILRGQWRERVATEPESIEPEPTGAAGQETEPEALETSAEAKVQEVGAEPENRETTPLQNPLEETVEILEREAEPAEVQEASAEPEIHNAGAGAVEGNPKPAQEAVGETVEVRKELEADEGKQKPAEAIMQGAGTEPESRDASPEPVMQEVIAEPEVPETSPESAMQPQPEQEAVAAKETCVRQPQPEAAHEEAVCRQPTRESASAKPERTVLSGDKWEQLSRLYPKIHPFADKREFLSLTPRDFVVLARGYHILVQNSFLLHGYYNYGHVVLTRTENRGEEIFYLGVPGVYFEREKQAALMFGFEGFEAANEQAEEGGFGYYMKRVEI